MADENDKSENIEANDKDADNNEHSNEGHEHTHDYEKADFVEFDYTAKDADGNIFDTTSFETAKEAGLQGSGNFQPLKVPLQQGYLLEGLRKGLEGKKPGHYDFDLEPEEAFGKKNPKLIRLISQSKFRAQDIKPYPGMPVKIDEQQGIVRTVSGGRVLVDFNHPMAGRKLTYEVDYKGNITDPAECLKVLLELTLRIPQTLVEVEKKSEGSYSLGLKLNEQWPKEILTEIEHMATGMIKGLDSLEIHYVKDDEGKASDDNAKNKQGNSEGMGEEGNKGEKPPNDKKEL